MAKIKDIVDIPEEAINPVEEETHEAEVPQENLPVVQKEKWSIWKWNKEFPEKHPKVAKAIKIGGLTLAAGFGAAFGFSKMAEAKGYGKASEDSADDGETIQFDGTDVDESEEQ